MSKIKAVILDVDGVIHDSFEFHRTRISEFVGVQLSEDVYRTMHNGNFFENTPSKFKDTDWNAYAKHIYREQSELEISQEIKKTLIGLFQQYVLFLVTSGSEVNISASLEFNAISQIFEEVLGRESHESKVEKFKLIFERNNITPDTCMFVTDTLGDIREAHELGIITIGVASDHSFHDRLTLEQGEPYGIISNLKEIHEVLESL